MQHLGILSIANRKIFNFDFDLTGNFLFLVTEHELIITSCVNFEILGIIKPPTRDVITIFTFSAAWNLIILVTQTSIWIYSLLTGEVLCKFDSPEGDYCTVASISQDGRFFVTGFNDGNYKLYRITPIVNTDQPPDDDLTIENFNFPEIIKTNKLLNFEIISEDHYEQSIISVSFSSGCELIGLGFDNGKAVIRTTDSQPQRQWLIEPYGRNSEVCIYFNPQNSLSFMTRGLKTGQIDFYTLVGPPRVTKKKTILPDVECYKTFKVGQQRIVTSDFNCDGTILYGASTKKIYAWRTDDGTLINKLEFEQNIEIDCFTQILPSLDVPEMALVMAKSSLWTWNCITNHLHCIVIQGYHDHLFQAALWFKSKVAMIQTNLGSISIYGCETLKWNLKEINLDEYNGVYSEELKNLLSEYEVPQLHRNMQMYEKRALQFFSEGYVATDLRSSSDFDSRDFGLYGKKRK